MHLLLFYFPSLEPFADLDPIFCFQLSFLWFYNSVQGKCWPLGLHQSEAHLKQCFPVFSSCFPSSGIFLVYPQRQPTAPPPTPLSSRQTWQASLHSDFQSRPVLCQMLRGNIKRSAGQSLSGIPAWWADNWRQASVDLADVWWVFTAVLFFFLCMGVRDAFQRENIRAFFVFRPLPPP